jgi:hypothetical protein
MKESDIPRKVDPEKVKELIEGIESYASTTDSLCVEVFIALISILTGRSIQMGISKANLLVNINNHWEVNDPENDHPLRATATKIYIDYEKKN